MFNILRISVFIAVMSLVTYSAQAQNVNSADDLLKMGGSAIRNDKDYPKAITLLRKAYSLSPDYTDVKILLGRAYQLNKQADSARHFFKDARLKEPANPDLLNYMIGLEYEAGNVERSITYIDSALVYHPRSEDFLLKKASMLYDQKQYTESQVVLKNLMAVNANNEKATRLKNQLNQVISSNKISLYYDYSHFDKLFKPWHSLSVSYQRTTPVGSVIGRINYANRSNGLAGYQYEVESYPLFTKSFYGNFSAALSSGDPVFPEFTAKAALFKALGSYEVEGGVRYLTAPEQKVFIYNAGLSKYVSNFLLNFKAYLSDFDAASGQGYQLSARYYYGENADDIFIFGAGTGVAPDLTNKNLGIANVTNLSGRRAFTEYRRVIGGRNILSLMASLGYDEYTTTKSANQYTVGFGYQRKF